MTKDVIVKKYVLALFAMVLLGTGIFIIKPNSQEAQNASDHEFYNKILQSNLADVVSQYKKGEAHAINFAETFPFGWDRVFFFGPFTTPSRINFVLGYSWPRARFLQIRFSEYDTLIVFTKEGKVVEYLEYPINLGDFSSLHIYTAGIPIDKAIFVTGETDELILLNKEE